MRKWLAITVALGAVFLFVSSSWSAAEMEVKGIIGDWMEGKTKIPDSAYFQLVKVEKEMKGTSDAQGLSAFDSKFPKISVQDDGSFRVDVKDLPKGRYIIALQRAVPREISTGDLKGAIPPILITGKGEPLIIEVPGSFPLDVGKVDVAIRAPKAPAASRKK